MKEKQPRAKHRPLISIDWNLVDTMLKNQCLGTEIAARLGMCADTLYRRIEEEKGMTFTAYASQKKADGQALLREKQFETAFKKNNYAMLIWLGKQYLGQRDTPEKTAEFTEEQRNLILNLLAQIDKLQKEKSVSNQQNL